MCMTQILGTCIIAMQLTGGGTYNPQLPEVAYSYDGKARSIERFYKKKKQPFHIGGSIVTRDLYKIDLYHNSGLETKKLDIDSTNKIQISKFIDLGKNWSVIPTAGYAFGGKKTHTSCIDKYNREYYCGTLTAWSDFKDKEKKNINAVNAGITFKYRF